MSQVTDEPAEKREVIGKPLHVKEEPVDPVSEGRWEFVPQPGDPYEKAEVENKKT